MNPIVEKIVKTTPFDEFEEQVQQEVDEAYRAMTEEDSLESVQQLRRYFRGVGR